MMKIIPKELNNKKIGEGSISIFFVETLDPPINQSFKLAITFQNKIHSFLSCLITWGLMTGFTPSWSENMI